MLDFYASISLDVLRDYLVFLVSILLFTVAIGTYINIKNLVLTRRIEKKMQGIYKIKEKTEVIAEFQHLQEISSKNIDINSSFGPLARLLDIYAVSITDETGKIVYANDLLYKLTGYSEHELIGKQHNILNSSAHPNAFWVEMYKSINNSRLWQGVIKNKRKDGQFCWTNTVIIPLSMFTNLQGFVSLRTDVSEAYLRSNSIQSELSKTIFQLQHAEKLLEKTDRMATLGTLVAGIAHEINNPISYVSSNISVLGTCMLDSAAILREISTCDPEKVDAVEYLRNLKEKVTARKLNLFIEDADSIVFETADGIKRIQQIVQDLRLYSHVNSDEFKMSDINQCVSRVMTMVGSELKCRVQIDLERGNIPPVLCIDSKIQQVLLNLVINAAQAIQGKGKIMIATSVEDAHWVNITVTDTGCGIPKQDLDSIFEPFFTTKPPGEGTGLGLAISKKIIDAHHGAIVCKSQIGRGTEFTIYLPLEESVSELKHAANC